MKNHLAFPIFIILCISFVCAKEENDAKQLSFFNVVKFPNIVCQGESNRNGTCYTSEECADKGGSAQGTCADGYGVCCVISIECGQSSKENCTYLVMESTNKPTTKHCTYTLCPLRSDICRIRLDLTVFQIAGPVTAITNSQTDRTRGGAIGDCAQDQFSVSSVGNIGSPIICGFNTGQHIFVDASESCSRASFTFNDDSETRRYDIKVTQFECGDTQGGPPECLQYFTSTAGEIASFNFPTTSATIGSKVTHLSNQHYSACFRRNIGVCAVCFYPNIAIAIVAQNTATSQSSFGISAVSMNNAVQSDTDAGNCQTDYLSLPYATRVISQATGSTLPTYDAGASNTNDLRDRLCGVVFLADEDQATTIAYAGVSTCTFLRPFMMRVDFDETEDVADDNDKEEIAGAPGGIIGFHLVYRQVNCT